MKQKILDIINAEIKIAKDTKELNEKIFTELDNYIYAYWVIELIDTFEWETLHDVIRDLKHYYLGRCTND